MKSLINKYNKLFFDTIKDRLLIICLIITILLTYGFMLSNFSVGVDDLCLDRYVNGTYILSAGRWGTWLVYKLLNITTFTPFWLEFLCILFLFLTSIILVVFLKSITKSKLNKFSYIFLGISYVSYPIISNFLVYQPTNLTVCISNLIMVFYVIILYEKYILNKDIKIGFLHIFLLSFIISMYESCCQTFVVLIFLVIFFHNKFNKEETFKKNFNFCIKSFLVLLYGIILNILLCEGLYIILDKFNILTKDFSSKSTILVWLENGNTIWEILEYKVQFLFYNKNFFSLEFILLSWIMLFLLVVESILNKNNTKYILWYLLAFFSNFILYFIMNSSTFRISYSWCAFIAFIFVYYIEFFKKHKNCIIVICIWLILLQSRSSNQLFYNEYKAYMRDVNYTNNIINKIIDMSDGINKPLLIISKSKSNSYYSDLTVTTDVRSDFYKWGIKAFEEDSIEIVKFFNHLGYNFKLVDNYDKYLSKYNELSYEERNNDVIVLDDFIVVKV